MAFIYKNIKIKYDEPIIWAYSLVAEHSVCIREIGVRFPVGPPNLFLLKPMNKTNLELKRFCSDFRRIREVLKVLGAKKETIKNQTDYFFNFPSRKARLKLRIEGNKQLLVYYERPDFSKSKSTMSKVKLYDIRDAELLKFLSETLGVKAVVKKRREVWRKVNTVFHIDTVEGVGGIFEIELQKKGKIAPSDQKLFKHYQNQLLPYLGRVIKGSNVDLVLATSK